MHPASPSAEGLGRRLLTGGFAVTVAAVGVQTAAHWTNAFLLDGSIWNLDADEEGNAFTWASAAATFAAALAALIWAAAFPERRRGFLVLAAILMLFSLDDVVQVHEQLGLEVGEEVFGLPDYLAVRLWTIFYLPLLVVTAFLLWDVPRVLWPRAARFVRAGLALLVAAIAVELVGAYTRWLEERGTRWPDDVRTGFEEAFELAAWILIAAGLVAALCVRLSSQAVGARSLT